MSAPAHDPLTAGCGGPMYCSVCQDARQKPAPALQVGQRARLTCDIDPLVTHPETARRDDTVVFLHANGISNPDYPLRVALERMPAIEFSVHPDEIEVIDAND